MWLEWVFLSALLAFFSLGAIESVSAMRVHASLRRAAVARCSCTCPCLNDETPAPVEVSTERPWGDL